MPRISDSNTNTSMPSALGVEQPKAQPAPTSTAPQTPPQAEPQQPFAQDSFALYSSPYPGQLLMAPPPKPEPQAPVKAVSVRELAAQEKTPNLTTRLNDTLSQKLSDPKLFDASTFDSSRALGMQLNTSVFDKLHATGDPKQLATGLRDLLNDRAGLEATLNRSLSHLPAQDRADAVQAVITKMEDKLCGLLQEGMGKVVHAQLEVAQAQVAPFCGDESMPRLKLADGLLNATPALTEPQLCARLERVGIPSSEAASIADYLVEVRADPSAREQLTAALRGDKSGSEWESGLIKDGVLRNLDEAMQAGFDEMRSGLDKISDQLSSDHVNNDALFNSPLFAQAKDYVFDQYGMTTSKGATPVEQLLTTRTEDEALKATVESYGSGLVLTLASLAAPGMGTIAAMALAGASAMPSVMIAQNHLDAAESGKFAGTNDAKTASDARTKRNIEVGAAIFSVAFAGLSGTAAGRLKEAKHGIDKLDDLSKAAASDRLGLQHHLVTDAPIALTGFAATEDAKLIGGNYATASEEPAPKDKSVAALQMERRFRP